jgi:hypothetical protein
MIEPCPKCGVRTRDIHKVDNVVCRTRIANARIRADGLVPAVAANDAKGAILTRDSKIAARALKLLGYHSTTAPTRQGGKSYGDAGCWTTIDGRQQLLVVRRVAKLLDVKLLEAVRRAVRRPKVIAAFDAAQRLGASEDALREILKPLRRV